MEEPGIIDEEEEGIIMDEDDEAMGFEPMAMPMPILPPFFMLTYDTFTVSHLVFNKEKKKKRRRRRRRRERGKKKHTSLMAGPATMLSSVACLSPLVKTT